MSDIIALPLKPFPVPHTFYEEFWNSEHVFVYEMFPSTPLKDRNHIVQQRWALQQKVAKAMADKRCSVAGLLPLKTQVKASCQEAHRLRAGKHFSPVDHLVRDCALERAKRARVRPLPSPTSDAHWITVCTSLLNSISNKEVSFSKDPPSPRPTPCPPSTPRKTTITDFFTSTPSSTSSSASSLYPRQGHKVTVLTDFFSPSSQRSLPSPTNSSPSQPSTPVQQHTPLDFSSPALSATTLWCLLFCHPQLQMCTACLF